MIDELDEEKYFGEHSEYWNEERKDYIIEKEDAALFTLKLREISSMEYGYNHIHKLTDFEAAKALIEREKIIREKSYEDGINHNTGERQYWQLRNALKFRFQDQFETALALMLSNHDFERKHPCVLPCGEKITTDKKDS